MTSEEFIGLVIDHMPPGTPLRSQIAMELRSDIAERVEHGQSLDEVLRQLGDPRALAESYLAAVPLESAAFWDRAAAKLVDWAMWYGGVGLVSWLVWLVARPTRFPEAILVAVSISVITVFAYFVVAESRTGQTLGKRLLGIRVVRESGARISVGQAVVRQLPVLLNIFWIDILFAVFTEKKQRAFELLSKTRVVEASV